MQKNTKEDKKIPKITKKNSNKLINILKNKFFMTIFLIKIKYF